ncbi:MAG: ABC transporter ATP-binding protein/permease [Clostridiales bacterium]|jgi:ABC-type multidrug transport system fused ATPase/permease subunit|nr:ABC transporter ATP-binding protein/permease [Clostridiales bacterium]
MRKRPSYSVILKIFSFLGPMRKTYLAGLALVSLEYVMLLVNPELNRLLVQLAGGESGNGTIMRIGLLFLALLLITPFSAYGRYLQEKSCSFGIQELRCQVFSHLQSIRLEKASSKKMGDLLTRLTNDANRAANMFQSYGFQCIIRFFVVLTASVAMLAAVDWRITLFSLLYCAITLLISTRVNPYVRRLDREAQAEVSASADFLLEAVGNLFIIRIFLLQKHFAARYRERCKVIYEKRVRFRSMSGLSYGMLDLLVFAAPALGFLAALLLGYTGNMADAVYIATLVGMMGDAALYGGTFILLIQSNLVAGERVMELFDIPADDDRISAAVIDPAADIVLEAEGLIFAYGENEPVVNNVSLRVKKGQHIAFVGGSGGGKSTLLKLIAALYEPTGGQLRYCGAGREQLSLADIRSCCSYVPQECTLFDGSIGENIRLGRPDCTQEEIEAAARAAELYDFITALPNGYETRVGESGSQISGGQRQRVAIARAYLKNAPILLLDEATAALDSATEEEVLRQLEPLIKQSTTITVAHRLSTVRGADCVHVMEGGRIIESGTHETLYEQNGRYRQLWDEFVNNGANDKGEEIG